VTTTDSRQVEAVVVDLLELIYPEHQSQASEEKLTCKFILIADNLQVCFVFGPVTDFPYHANLVERFCIKQGIPSGWVHKPDLHEIYDADYRIKGGGMMQINQSEKTLKIFGASTAYGRYDRHSLDYLVAHHPFFTGYSVIVK
jgi:hypothetical protein